MVLIKILVLGANGFIGSHLVAALKNEGHEVFIGKRSLTQVNEYDWAPQFAEVEVIVNLAGAPISAKRWRPAVKQNLIDSRIGVVQGLRRAIESGALCPKVVINSSAMGIYGDCGDQWVSDLTDEMPLAFDYRGRADFLASLAMSWENEALALPVARVVVVRTGIVLGHGGALTTMTKPYRWGVGGPIGTGRQWLPWIHIDDMVRVICFCIITPDIHGPVNACAPEPVTMKTFCQALAEAMHRPNWFKVPVWLVQLMLGELSTVVLNSQRGRPQKLLTQSFSFKFTEVESALKHLFGSNKPL